MMLTAYQRRLLKVVFALMACDIALVLIGLTAFACGAGKQVFGVCFIVGQCLLMLAVLPIMVGLLDASSNDKKKD
jgi:hypothetical protein